MKILYLSIIDRSNKKEIGILRKIENQKKAFEKLGFKIKLTYIEKNLFYIGNKSLKYSSNNVEKIKNKFILPKQIKQEILNEDFDILYIRKSGLINNNYLDFLKKLKKQGKKIILELPTYPYDQEIKGIKRIIFLIEKYYRKKLKGTVDFITYFGQAGDTIWGVPALKLENGIDVDKILLKKERIKDGKINFIAVANLSNWHGYDRFIKSMANLDNSMKEKVFFHIVGEGSVWQELKNLTKKLKLERNIIFYGAKCGKELNKIFDRCDVGIGSLGAYRKGLNEGSELKLREYCARGIPFFNGVKDSMFDEKFFKYTVLNDSSLFDVEDIIKWFNELEVKPIKIRKYAEENLSWDIQMKKVIDRINFEKRGK